MELGRNYGSGVDNETQITILWRVLPSAWKQRVMDKPELRTPAATIKYIQQQLRYLRAEKLADAKAGKADVLRGPVSGSTPDVASNPAFIQLMKNTQKRVSAVSSPPPPAASTCIPAQ